MGYAKDTVNVKARRDFIIKLADELLHNTNNSIYTYTDAYHEIADNHLFCHVSTVYRALTLKQYKKVNNKTNSSESLTLKF